MSIEKLLIYAHRLNLDLEIKLEVQAAVGAAQEKSRKRAQFLSNLLEIRPEMCYIKPIVFNSLHMILQAGRGSGSALIF